MFGQKNAIILSHEFGVNIMRIVFIIGAILLSAAKPLNEQGFYQWIDQFKIDALAQGIQPQTLHYLNQASFLPKLITLDQKQPETRISLKEYHQKQLLPQRLKQAHIKREQHNTMLMHISRAYKIEPEILLSLWAIETNLGQNMGSTPILSALATLAYEGRREALFKQELISLLQLLEHKIVQPQSLIGSWAGAMGQCQFMPSTFQKYAVDGNQDGKIDIWHDPHDALSSMANYLHHLGWRHGEIWGERVKLPKGFDKNLASTKIQHPTHFWHNLGVRLYTNHPLPQKPTSAIIIDEIDPDYAFIVYDNFFVLLGWNRSRFFASLIGLFAERVQNFQISGK